jgi:serine/threonine protein kinase
MNAAESFSPESTPGSPPTVLDGKYALLRELGSGAAGRVYEAENLIVGKRVAIKVLDRELAKLPAIRARFVSEARAAARIGHANVVDIYDLGMSANGEPYLVMELLSGETLSEIIRTRGPIPAEYACELMLQMLAGLGAAHQHGIVHRDLKPANIIVTHPRPDRPLVKVLDFGIAEGLLEAVSDGGIWGTPQYMAPEQALGQQVDERADVYSAGAILFEMLSSVPAFNGTNDREILARVLLGKRPGLLEVNPKAPATLAELVESALSTDREHRLKNVAEFARRLAPFVSQNRVFSLLPNLAFASDPVPLFDARDRRPDGGARAPIPLLIAPHDSAANDRSNDEPVASPSEVKAVVRLPYKIEPYITDSVLAAPRIPRAPRTPTMEAAVRASLQALGVSPESLSRDLELAGIPKKRRGLGIIVIATLLGFGFGLALAWAAGLI